MSRKLNILVALSRFPYPTNKGDKLRAYYQIKEMSRNYNIFLVCLTDKAVSDKDIEHMSQLCQEVLVFRQNMVLRLFNLFRALFNDMPFQTNLFRSRPMYEHIGKWLKEKNIDVCYVQLVRLFINIPFEQEKVFYLDYMDAFSLGMYKRAKNSLFPFNQIVKIEASRLERFEKFVGPYFDGLSIITRQDAKNLETHLKQTIDIVPNGISKRFFREDTVEKKEFDIIFLGNMGYYPNIEASKYLVKEVLPQLEKYGLDVKICLVGINPSSEVKKLQSDRVVVTGFVDDVTDYLQRSRLFVAPLFNGQGLQNKILEAMAAGLPVITTTLAYSAFENRAQSGIIEANDVKEFSFHIEKLIKDKRLRKALGEKGKNFVHTNYDWPSSVLLLTQRFEALVKEK